MSALPPDQTQEMRESAKAQSSDISACALILALWEKLHLQSGEIAQLAQLSPEPFVEALATFPSRTETLDTSRQGYILQALEDVEAMIQPGLAALRALSERGTDVQAPALALWREFYEARAGMLALAPDAALTI